MLGFMLQDVNFFLKYFYIHNKIIRIIFNGISFTHLHIFILNFTKLEEVLKIPSRVFYNLIFKENIS